MSLGKMGDAESGQTIYDGAIGLAGLSYELYEYLRPYAKKAPDLKTLQERLLLQPTFLKLCAVGILAIGEWFGG